MKPSGASARSQGSPPKGQQRLLLFFQPELEGSRQQRWKWDENAQQVSMLPILQVT